MTLLITLMTMIITLITMIITLKTMLVALMTTHDSNDTTRPEFGQLHACATRHTDAHMYGAQREYAGQPRGHVLRKT